MDTVKATGPDGRTHVLTRKAYEMLSAQGGGWHLAKPAPKAAAKPKATRT